jgi:hypothetical protein
MAARFTALTGLLYTRSTLLERWLQEQLLFLWLLQTLNCWRLAAGVVVALNGAAGLVLAGS